MKQNIKAAIFALKLEIKANLNTPFHDFLHNNLRNHPVEEPVRIDPLIHYVGEYHLGKRKSDDYNQFKDRMRPNKKGQTCSPTRMLILDWNNQTRYVVESGRQLQKILTKENGMDSETAAAFLQSPTFVFEKNAIPQQRK